MKLDKVDKRIHPQLAPGVYPLKPVNGQWTVNKKTDSKVTRRGFALVPDFACTGFMMQGATLDCEIAECGDVLLSKLDLTAMLTTYVIFSRVRKAHGLLLMRAFSPMLFRLGAAPGPICLLKLLRRAFPHDPARREASTYNVKEATQEYEAMTEAWSAKKKEQKENGMQWKCFDCSLSFPG